MMNDEDDERNEGREDDTETERDDEDESETVWDAQEIGALEERIRNHNEQMTRERRQIQGS